MAASALASGFSSSDAARILHLPVQQIAAWQRAGLVREGSEPFNVRDLSNMRRLRALRGSRVSTRALRLSAAAVRCSLLADWDAANVLPEGARLMVRHGGALLDPLTQQFAFDFDGHAVAQPVCLQQKAAPSAHPSDDFSLAQEFFQRAVLLEERAETIAAAADLYSRVLALWPAHAPANVNLGTILYNQHRYAEAEQRYRTAAEIDPDYALAFFDLGNVLDELRRLPEAVAAYLRAIQLVPQYADAHYNLALAYERLGERRRALRHWMHYVRLDPVGPWAAHARTQAKKALSSEKLRVVSRYGRRAS